jgi:hypothetical protein
MGNPFRCLLSCIPKNKTQPYSKNITPYQPRPLLLSTGRVRLIGPAVLTSALTKSQLPPSLLSYLKTNASPKLLLKLMQTSKFFRFTEFPYKVISDLKFDGRLWTYRPLGLDKPYQNFEENDVGDKKLWITTRIYFSCGYPNFVHELISEIAACDVQYLTLQNQVISLDDFNILTSFGKIQSLGLLQSVVKYEDGRIVPIEEILTACKDHLLRFYFSFSDETLLNFSFETTRNIMNVINTEVLKSFTLCEIPEAFDIKTFFNDFMQKHPSIDYALLFKNGITNDLQKMLQGYVELIIKNRYNGHRPPFLQFPNQTEESTNTLKKLRNEM